MERTLSIKIPEDVFQKLQRAASLTQRTIDDVIVNTVNATFVTPTELPAPIADELAIMRQMKDESLWETLPPSVTVQQQKRLEELSVISEQRSLSPEESDEQQALLEAHHHSVLRRAQAIAILTLRGYRISDELLAHTVR
jgi:hypothetical protein